MWLCAQSVGVMPLPTESLLLLRRGVRIGKLHVNTTRECGCLDTYLLINAAALKSLIAFRCTIVQERPCAKLELTICQLLSVPNGVVNESCPFRNLFAAIRNSISYLNIRSRQYFNNRRNDCRTDKRYVVT